MYILYITTIINNNNIYIGAFILGLKNKETKYPILHSISGTWIPVINPLKNNKNSNNTITTNNNAANIELKYVRILPAKKYHWHYSQEIANNH